MDLTRHWRVGVPAAALVALAVYATSRSWLVPSTIAEPDCASVLAEAAPADPRREFAAGLCLEDRGRLDEATAMFLAAAGRLDGANDRALALHNAGTVLARRGRDAEALDAWREALRLGDRESTRRNYEIVAARVRRTSPPRLQAGDAPADRLIDAARALERPRRRDAGASSGGW